MTVKITKIHIKNFRSARNLTVSPQRLAVLVGKNDSGKSNILRALNLFFNDQTDSGNSLRFEIDHNVFNQPNRRAKQISIRLEIELPDTYRYTNGDSIVWERRWRTEGLVFDQYYGQRLGKGQRGGIWTEQVDIPDKSNVHALLRNMNFVYVPAIKDLEYFSQLRASIYDVIAEAADQTFRNSSQEFEQSILDQLLDLTSEIEKSLGFQSRLALPRDLSHIFESLDFLSQGQNISLDERGDGIKARHISLILKFMVDRKRSLQAPGAVPHSFIWGYEEPENNLELASCMELADQFRSFMDNGISQVFLTTHSPVFYNLREKQEVSATLVSCHHIFRDIDDEGTKETQGVDDLDERMGTMALFAPMAKELENRLIEMEADLALAEQLAQTKRRTLFVEGTSDQEILRKALKVFAPNLASEIDIETKPNGAGYNYVIDMLGAWASNAKHSSDIPRAAGLVDLDSDAESAANNWNSEARNIPYAKCFKLKKPKHIIPAYRAGFKPPIVLETLYDREAWEWADNEGWLVDANEKNLSSILPNGLMNRIIKGETTINENLDSEWGIYVLREFDQASKGSMAKHFAGKPDTEFRHRLAGLEPVIFEIVGYLFPESQE